MSGVVEVAGVAAVVMPLAVVVNEASVAAGVASRVAVFEVAHAVEVGVVEVATGAAVGVVVAAVGVGVVGVVEVAGQLNEPVAVQAGVLKVLLATLVVGQWVEVAGVVEVGAGKTVVAGVVAAVQVVVVGV